MKAILEYEYIFVTNNRADFLELYGREPLHPGLIIIVPSVRPALQQELLGAAITQIGSRDITNTVVEVGWVVDEVNVFAYEFPFS